MQGKGEREVVEKEEKMAGLSIEFEREEKNEIRCEGGRQAVYPYKKEIDGRASPAAYTGMECARRKAGAWSSLSCAYEVSRERDEGESTGM